MSQETIYNAVADRGYSPDQLHLDPDQYAARQMCKVIEEALEAMRAVALPGYPDFMYGLSSLERSFKDMFDDVSAWQLCQVDRSRLLAELPDVAIPAFNAAQALGVDLMAISEGKAARDAGRGVR